jgi:hypothetical protein
MVWKRGFLNLLRYHKNMAISKLHLDVFGEMVGGRGGIIAL